MTNKITEEFNLDSLNEEQLKPVLHTEGAVMVTAGAGSGKTRLLTHRIAHLVKDKNVRKYNILALTFTNKAAAEMRERLERMIECEGMWIMTFHAMCARILRADIDRLGYSSNFSVYTESDKERVMKRLLKEMELDPDKFLKTALSAVGDLKNNNITVEEYVRLNSYYPYIKELEKLIRAYEAELKASNALDFDDLLSKVLDLLKSSPEILEKYQEKFKYIMVDEFQDTNQVQYEITKLLAGKYRNVFVVGDEDQSIYGWRGANFKNLLKITKDFDCAVYKLEQNYRSTKKILNAANAVIKNNSTRIDKTLWTKNADGVRIEIYSGNDEAEEAEYITSQIASLKNHGYSYSDFAVLIRLNALSRPFEERLLTYNIPHIVFGGIKFYERKEIKDIAAYLKVASNYRDTESLLRIINYPKRGIGDAVIAQLKNYCAVSNKYMAEVILDIKNNEELPLSLIKKIVPFAEILRDIYEKKDSMPISAFVPFVLKRSGISETLNDDSEESINRRMNLDDFMSSVIEYDSNNTSATLDEFLQSITLYTDLDDMDDKKNAVSIATMHSAKGLEFKVVFVAGLDEGVMPISRALDDPGDLEEERRLMYVAVTRARERLYLTRARSRFLYGARKYTMESRFLNEAAPERVKKTILTEKPAETPLAYSPQFKRVELERQQGVDFSQYTVGRSVMHNRFGEGKIINVLGSGNNVFVSVDFKSVGVKNIALAIAKLEILD